MPTADANNIFAQFAAFNFANLPQFQFPNYNNLPGAVEQPAAAAAPAAVAPGAPAAPQQANNGAAATGTAPISFQLPPPFQLPLLPPMPANFMPFPRIVAPPPLLVVPAPPALPPGGLAALTDEELRQMEGHQREHIEQRLQHLRQIRLMLDATTAMWTQYTGVMAALPPLPEIPAPAPVAANVTEAATKEEDASTPTAGPSSSATSMTSAAASTTSASKPAAATAVTAEAKAADVVRLEDVGSEEHIDRVASAATLGGQAPSAASAASGTDAAANELRRRRLEKFAAAQAGERQQQ